MHVLGVIPARGGSKGIPHKNLRQVGGRSLLSYTADAARASLRLTRVAFVQGGEPKLRHRLERLWWWLGREEFWRSVHADGLRCTQMTFMVFLLVVGAQ